MSGVIKGVRAREFAERAGKNDFSYVTEVLLKLIKADKKQKILDLCAGSGNLIPFISDKAGEIVAVDASEEMIKIMDERFSDEISTGSVKTVLADAEKLPFDDKEFDKVIIKFSVHHLSDVSKVFDECYRVLKDDGEMVIIDMVFDSSVFFRILEPFWRLRKMMKHGMHEYGCKYRSIGKLEKIFTDSGFVVDKKVKVKKESKRFKDKHYPTYIYLLKVAPLLPTGNW